MHGDFALSSQWVYANVLVNRFIVRCVLYNSHSICKISMPAFNVPSQSFQHLKHTNKNHKSVFGWLFKNLHVWHISYLDQTITRNRFAKTIRNNTEQIYGLESDILISWLRWLSRCRSSQFLRLQHRSSAPLQQIRFRTVNPDCANCYLKIAEITWKKLKPVKWECPLKDWNNEDLLLCPTFYLSEYGTNY